LRLTAVWLLAAVLGVALPAGAYGATATPAKGDATQHSDPLNFDPMVHEGYERFYVLDFDGSISWFEKVLKAHPQDPMAYGCVLMGTVVLELYNQDLLDKTYYAHDNFLTSKRNVPVVEATRQRIEYLTDTAVRLADEEIKANSMNKDAYFARG